MQLQLLNFRQYRGSLILQRSPLRGEIFRRILARAVFEIQVAKVLVQHVFLFAQKIEPRFCSLPRSMPLRIEDKGKRRQQEKATDNGAHIWVSRRMRSRVAAKPGESGIAG